MKFNRLTPTIFEYQTRALKEVKNPCYRIREWKKHEEKDKYSGKGAAEGSAIIIFLQGTLLAPTAAVISL